MVTWVKVGLVWVMDVTDFLILKDYFIVKTRCGLWNMTEIKQLTK